MSGEDCTQYKRDLRAVDMPRGCVSCKRHDGFSCTARKRGRDLGGHYVSDAGETYKWED